jgi:hypothetical protein
MDPVEADLPESPSPSDDEAEVQPFNAAEPGINAHEFASVVESGKGGGQVGGDDGFGACATGAAPAPQVRITAASTTASIQTAVRDGTLNTKDALAVLVGKVKVLLEVRLSPSPASDQPLLLLGLKVQNLQGICSARPL